MTLLEQRHLEPADRAYQAGLGLLEGGPVSRTSRKLAGATAAQCSVAPRPRRCRRLPALERQPWTPAAAWPVLMRVWGSSLQVGRLITAGHRSIEQDSIRGRPPAQNRLRVVVSVQVASHQRPHQVARCSVVVHDQWLALRSALAVLATRRPVMACRPVWAVEPVPMAGEPRRSPGTSMANPTNSWVEGQLTPQVGPFASLAPR